MRVLHDFKERMRISDAFIRARAPVLAVRSGSSLVGAVASAHARMERSSQVTRSPIWLLEVAMDDGEISPLSVSGSATGLGHAIAY